MANEWIAVGDEAAFEEGLHFVAVDRKPVVIARLDGRLFGFDALCPHQKGPMKRAEVDGRVVTCPLHAWRFDLDKCGKELHNYRDLQTYPVKVEDGQVFLRFGA